MDLEQAIKTRRTHKAYGSDPVERATLDELFELARWAPNHNPHQSLALQGDRTRALARLKDAAGPEGAAKLDRAPTLVLVTVRQTGDELQDEEDLAATSVATYIVLLAAHARGLAGYWRTPGVLRTPRGGRRSGWRTTSAWWRSSTSGRRARSARRRSERRRSSSSPTSTDPPAAAARSTGA